MVLYLYCDTKMKYLDVLKRIRNGINLKLNTLEWGVLGEEWGRKRRKKGEVGGEEGFGVSGVGVCLYLP